MSTSPRYGNLLAAILNNEQHIPLTNEQQHALNDFNISSGSPEGISSSWLKEMYNYSNEPNTKRDESCLQLKEACLAALAKGGKKGNIARLFKWAAPAAAAALIAGLLVYTYKPAGTWPTKDATHANSSPNKTTDFPPGESRATLYLADDQKIDLEKSSRYKTEFAGTRISVIEGDILTYKTLGTSAGTSSMTNRLTTPKAGKYKVQLSDGSIVHLDAATTIEYPVVFTGNAREVKLLEGQAYFEVKKGKKIFTVINKEFRIDVLGTTFNVNTYGTDSTVKTTLLEGTIKFSSDADRKVLSPGQQLEFNKEENQLTITKIDTAEAATWVKGTFSFDRLSIRDIMKYMERWYDVSIAIEGNVSDNHYTLQLSRNNSLESSLRALSSIEQFRFEILEERKVRIWK